MAFKSIKNFLKSPLVSQAGQRSSEDKLKTALADFLGGGDFKLKLSKKTVFLDASPQIQNELLLRREEVSRILSEKLGRPGLKISFRRF